MIARDLVTADVWATAAFAEGERAIEHLNQVDDIGRLFNRCRNTGIDIQFGMGRHPTSGSIHLYVYGPDNFVWEYTLGMEQFPEAGARQPRFMSDKPEHFDLWGAVPDNTRSDILPIVDITSSLK